MARDPAGTYSYPAGIEGVPDQTIDSNDYNAFLHDVQTDLNFPRPITSGGTGARSANEAMTNLSGEIAKQLVDNYDMFPFSPGSFYSIGGATAEPVAGHNFIGICYMKDADNIVLEARDESDTTKPGRRYVRERKITPPATGSAWLPWHQEGLAIVDNGGGDISVGVSGSAADMVFGLRGTAPASYFAVNTESDGSGINALQVNKDGSVTFTGKVTLPSTPPTAPTDTPNKAYVDAGDATANAAAAAASTAAAAANTAATNANSNANNRVLKSGDTMTSDLTVHRNSAAGYVWLGNTSARYIGFDGSNYAMPNGGLTVGGGISSGNISCGAITASGISNFIDHCLVAGAGQPCFAVHNTSAHVAWGFWVDNTGGSPMRIGNTDGSAVPAVSWAEFQGGGNLVIANQGSKPGGGPWGATSDARIKNVQGNFSSGLDIITALNPVYYTYKGNDTTWKADDVSYHAGPAARGTVFIGLVAQEAEAVMPELVTQQDGFIDGVAVTDLRTLDTGPLIYALINSIKELKARVETLEAQVASG
jgi:hypothetical protein